MNDSAVHDKTDLAEKIVLALGISVLLILIVVAAAYLRLVGLDWDEGQHLHPDERHLTMVESAIRPANSLAEYFDTATSTLNPNNVGYGFFVYGDFPVILVRYLGEAVQMTTYYDVYLVGRVASAVADLLALVLLFFIGRRLFDWRIGLLAAALYAGAALPIQLSHFFTVDTFTNLFAVASFLFIARALYRHNWLDYPLFGLMLGLSMASKVNIAPLALILILALGLRYALRESGQQNQEGAADEVGGLSKEARAALVRALVGLGIAGLVTVITFRVAQPYAFLPANSGVPIDAETLGPAMSLLSRIGDPIGMRPNPAWLAQMNEVRQQVSGYSDIPPNHQWGQRLPLIFPWVNMARVGLGWPLGILCWLAFAWAMWELARRHRGSERLILPAAWIALLFTWQGIGWVKTMRYFLPVYPFLILLAAWALVTLWDRIQVLLASRSAPRWHWAGLVSAGLAAVVLLSAWGWGFAVSRIYTRPVTRVAASRWMLENIPSDVTLLFDTPTGPREFQLGMLNNWLPPDQAEDDPTQPVVKYTSLTEGRSQPANFVLPFGGTLTGIRFNHIHDPSGSGAVRTLHVTLTSDPTSASALAESEISADFGLGDDLRGASYLIEFGPVNLTAGKTYYLVLKPDGKGPLEFFSANVAVEGDWDDSLPLPLAPYNVWDAQYQGYKLQMAWDDIPEKRERIEYILDRTDYIVISSNRFYASMPRNPQRFPLTIAYYRALFSGELGFDLVGDFTSRPNLGPIQFYDDDAEEAWTVYDHPHVLIFHKSDRYDPARTAEILGSVDLTKVVKAIAKDAAGPPVILQPPVMSPATTPAQTPFVAGAAADADPSDFYTRFQPITVILWWLLMAIFGWLAFPALWVILPGLDDRGYPLSRMFGLLLAAWAGWVLASLKAVPWSGWSALIGLGTLAALSAVLIIPRRVEFVAWLAARRRHLIFIEALLAILFLIFVLIRLGNPDLWHPFFGGEKPMDMAYFNAVLKSQTFPPYDPWFAGGTINYYYFGYVIVGLPLKLLHIPMTLAYNLILPTLFALTGAGAFSVAYNLIASPHARVTHTQHTEIEQTPRPPSLWQALRAWPRTSWGDILAALRGPDQTEHNSNWQPYVAGIAALLLAAILGNLDEIRTVVWGLAELGSGKAEWAIQALPDLNNTVKGLGLAVGEGQALPIGLGEWYWNATRLVPVPITEDGMPTEVGPITEFPFFTFLYADLHAHMIAMPITLLALVWCVAQIRGTRSGFQDEPQRKRLWLTLLNILSGALIIGALRPTNTWDWPTYLALGVGALALARFYDHREEHLVPALGIGTIFATLLGGSVYLFAASATPTFNLLADQTALAAVLGGAVVGFVGGFALGRALIRPRRDVEPDASDRLSSWVTLLGAAVQVAALTAMTFVFYLPYILTYRLGYTSFAPWTGSHTPLWAYVDILGLFLFVIVSWMAWETWNWLRRIRETGGDHARLLPLIAATASCLGIVILGIVIVALVRDYPVAALSLPLSLWAIVLFFRLDMSAEKKAVLAVVVLALSLSLLVEIIVLQGDISRMNTVFKFYVQVWILMAVAAGAAFGWLWPELRRARDTIRTPWIAALIILVFLAALYPLLATRAKIADRWSNDAPHTLDGMAYMPYVQRYENGAVFSLQPDYYVLRWLQDNIEGTPVMLEAQTVEYNWGSRVSVYTGLPTVVGWSWHQRQQRGDPQAVEVLQRVFDVQEMYNTTDINHALAMLKQYEVKLIIVGDLERAYYNAAGLDKFKTMVQMGYLKAIYERDNTVIYEMQN